MDGEPLEPAHVIGTMALLLIAGIDTTWSAIGASIWHLAATPTDRERLVAEPDLLPTAMEELLRAYAPVTMARLVQGGHGLQRLPDEGRRLGAAAVPGRPTATRRSFDDADEVIIDREVNRHAAFGLGIHRCAGSHLARMELRVALEVWLEHFPTFSLADPDAVRLVGRPGARARGSCRSGSADPTGLGPGLADLGGVVGQRPLRFEADGPGLRGVGLASASARPGGPGSARCRR